MSRLFRSRRVHACGGLRHMCAGLALLLVAACAGRSATVRPTPEAWMSSLLPLPASIDLDSGAAFTITTDTVIRIDPDDERVRRIARVLAELIGPWPGANPRIEPLGDPALAGGIVLSLDAASETMGPEGYELSIERDRVRLTASEPAGLFYGVQTLRQLLPPIVEYEAARRSKHPLQVPLGRIVDSPRFAWRGAMLDVARHFFGVDDVKRYIDLLVLHKINRLHLHLSDDQGWRLEIRSWPNLALHGGKLEVGGTPGGYYSQQDYTEIVRYAQERFVTIVPEIDVPGHINSALASYPELNCDGVAPPLYTEIEVGFSALCVDKDVTYRFLDDVIREIAALTPGEFFHVGGDEVKTLTDDQYRTFIGRVQQIVQSHGKRMIGWDEVAAAALAPTSVVQHWRPEASSASLSRAPALILSPADRVYLDMKYHADTWLGLSWAALIEVQRTYDWDPARLMPGVSERLILGVEGPLWSETVANMRDVEYLAFPRIAAVAEIGWSRAEDRDWQEFRTRLARQAPRWTALGINFYRSPQVPWQP